MNEIQLLNLFLSAAFVLAPLMTNHFFLNNSQAYSDAHKVSLAILLMGAAFNQSFLAAIWPLFCAFGVLLYLIKNGFTLSAKKNAAFIPFLFSLISATWFFAGINDWHLLGYDRAWSFYAALHGSFLGWMFVGCLAFLSRRQSVSQFYLWGCYLSLIFFLLVAFGIDGIPYIKRIGVVGFSLMTPLLIGHYFFALKGKRHRSHYLAALSLLSIVLAMMLATLNEFWESAPRIVFGIPIMVFTHGFLNAILTVPCFYLAILFEKDKEVRGHSVFGNVIFFDGLCVLCSGTVNLLIELDKHKALRYSSLQGRYVHEVLDSQQVKSGESVVFLAGGVLHEKAEAVIQILLVLGGGYRCLGLLLKLFPLFVLNGIYDLIARHRYYFFGKNDSCLIPKEENRNLFLP